MTKVLVSRDNLKHLEYYGSRFTLCDIQVFTDLRAPNRALWPGYVQSFITCLACLGLANNHARGVIHLQHRNYFMAVCAAATLDFEVQVIMTNTYQVPTCLSCIYYANKVFPGDV